MRRLILALVFGASLLSAQAADPLEGLWQGYDGEWGHVSKQLIALAQAMPPDKFAWRPGPGVRSTSEVFMHIAIANFSLLSVTGPKMPGDLTSDSLEKTVTDKAEVIRWLTRSLDAVKEAHAGIRPAALERKVTIAGKTATVDGMYLRIIVHANEHMGQLIAYARMNGIAPPWSAPIVAGAGAKPLNPDIAGRWTGVADTTDEAGTKRQEKQTVEIRMEDGKLTGNRIDKAGKAGLQLDVQQAGLKVNLYVYLDFEGGEPLRWKLELKDGQLVGTFSAQHHNPAKWIYDRVGAITMTKEK